MIEQKTTAPVLKQQTAPVTTQNKAPPATLRTVSAPTAKQVAKKQNKKIIKAAKKASQDAAVTSSQINNAKDTLVKAVEKSFKTVANAVNEQKKTTDELTAKITGAAGPISKNPASGPKRNVTVTFTNVPDTTSVGVAGSTGANATGAMQNMSKMTKQ